MTADEIRSKIEQELKTLDEYGDYPTPSTIQWDTTPFVSCDYPCFALRDPQTLEETKAALQHYKEHSWLGGCAHGH